MDVLNNLRTKQYIYNYISKIRHVYTIFGQNFSEKNVSPFQNKTFAETTQYVPKVLRKGNPSNGPFAQLSYLTSRIINDNDCDINK